MKFLRIEAYHSALMDKQTVRKFNEQAQIIAHSEKGACQYHVKCSRKFDVILFLSWPTIQRSPILPNISHRSSSYVY